MSSPVQKVLTRALARVLRPFLALWLKHGLSFQAFEEMARWVMVDIASKDFSLKEKRPSDSRISVITGLTRHQVRHYRSIELEESPVQAKTNRATRVLTGWLTDPNFLDNGQPISLKLDGLGRHFQELTQAHAGDVPHKAILDELVALKSVEVEGNVVRLLTRGFIPNEDECAILEMIGEDSAAFLGTLEHNLNSDKSQKWFQKKVSYGNLPLEQLHAMRKQQARQAQELLEHLNGDLETLQKEPGELRKRAGWGIYYFETGEET
jgi:hypothetical protein